MSIGCPFSLGVVICLSFILGDNFQAAYVVELTGNYGLHLFAG